MKAIGYVRISKKDQSNYSLDYQENSIREYCHRNQVELESVYIDDGESSYTFDRPDYQALESFIKQHKGRVR
jgi:DNA invertase Pin-like site-specific DNA recombinase